MKKTAFLILFLFFGCASWHPIAFQNAASLSAAQILFRDVHSLTQSKATAPIAYNPVSYAMIDADIINCERLYSAVDKNGLSLDQLKLLRHSLSLYQKNDERGAGTAFFVNNGPSLDSIATSVVNLETAKLIQP